MIERSESIVNIIKALHKAQMSISGVVKDAKNPHFKNSYASLAAVVETAKGPLNDNGITFMQALGKVVDDKLEVTTMLMHTSGEWLASTLQVPLGKKDAQGVGSASTYAQRYSLMAMLGLPPVDDDGEGTKPAEIKRLSRQESEERTLLMAGAIIKQKTLAELEALKKGEWFRTNYNVLLEVDQEAIATAYGDRKAELEGA